MDGFKKVLKADSVLNSLMVKDDSGKAIVQFDAIYGVPSEFDGDRLVCRGNVIRLPRFENRWSDVLDWSESMVFLDSYMPDQNDVSNEFPTSKIKEKKKEIEKQTAKTKHQDKNAASRLESIKIESNAYARKGLHANYLESIGMEIKMSNLEAIIDKYIVDIRDGDYSKDRDEEEFIHIIQNHEPRQWKSKPEIQYCGLASVIPADFSVKYKKYRITYKDILELDKTIQHVVNQDGRTFQLGVGNVKTIQLKGVSKLSPDKFRATMKYLISVGWVKLIDDTCKPGVHTYTYRLVLDPNPCPTSSDFTNTS